MPSKFPAGTTLKRVCKECGGAIETKGVRGPLPEYCSAPCRRAFNMRRESRGAQLYDLYMANRWERDEATAQGVRRAMDRLVSGWRDEDFRERAGRPSWGDWKAFLANRLSLTADFIHSARAPWSAGRTKLVEKAKPVRSGIQKAAQP